jgi:DNA-binding response OmpR family regulator
MMRRRTRMQPRRVLVVDDEPVMCDFLEAALEEAGCTVTIAHNGREAMASFSAGGYDVVVTDLSMPEKDGVQVIIEIRRLNPPVAIVAMSGAGDRESLLRMAKMFEADTLIRKPFTAQQLAEAIETACRRRYGENG